MSGAAATPLKSNWQKLVCEHFHKSFFLSAATNLDFPPSANLTKTHFCHTHGENADSKFVAPMAWSEWIEFVPNAVEPAFVLAVGHRAFADDLNRGVGDVVTQHGVVGSHVVGTDHAP